MRFYINIPHITERCLGATCYFKEPHDHHLTAFQGLIPGEEGGRKRLHCFASKKYEGKYSQLFTMEVTYAKFWVY